MIQMTDHDPDPMDLWYAAKHGNVEHVKDLLYQYQPLMQCHTFREYINHGHYEDGTTPLIVAIKYDRKKRRYFDHFDRHLAVVKLLLDHGADVSVKSESNETALYWSLWNSENTEYMDLLLEGRGIDINHKVDGRTALMDVVSDHCSRTRAAWEDQISTLLCRDGVDTNTLDEKGYSLLHQVPYPDGWLLQKLRPFDIDINRICNGSTPLLYAIERGRQSLVFADKRERQCFDWRQRSLGKLAGAVKTLLDNGADIWIKDGAGRTAIEAAESFIPNHHHAMHLLQDQHFRDLVMAFATGTHGEKNPPNCLLGNLSPEHVRGILNQVVSE